MKYSIYKAEQTNSKSASANGQRYDVGVDEDASEDPGIGMRHLQSLLLALGVFCGYLQRVNLSVTIVAISKMITYDENSGNRTSSNDFPTYAWSNEIRSYLLSSFFIGYLIMNFPAAVVGAHVNNKFLLMATFLINGIISCLTPFFIMFDLDGSSNVVVQYLSSIGGAGNWKLLMVLRGVQGLFQAFMFPTIHSIIAKWAPPNERSRLVGFIMSGIPLGTMVTLAGSGFLCSSSFGWPSVFYASGGIGIIWAFIWWILGSNNPEEHKTISRAEYTYIRSRIQINSVDDGPTKIPWKAILTSWHVWAIVIAHTGQNWGFWLLLSEMPTFINSILGFNIKTDGQLSALPYLCMWLLQFPVMYIADILNKHNITSITASRKIWNSIGMWGATISLIVLGYLDDNTTAALALYVSAVTISCCNNVGFNVNHMDLTPNYAGILMGMSNGLAATGGLGAPLIVAYIVHDLKSVTEWRLVFYVGAAITFFSNLFFVVFGSGETQPWNAKYIDR